MSEPARTLSPGLSVGAPNKTIHPASPADAIPRTQPDAKLGLRYIRQVFLTALPIWFAEVLAVCLTIFAAGCVVRFANPDFTWNELALECAVWAGALSLVHACVGLYPGIGVSPANELRLCTLSLLGVIGASWIGGQLGGKLELVEGMSGFIALPFLIVMIPLARNFARKLCCRQSWWGIRVVVFGDQMEARSLLKTFAQRPWLGIKPVGIVGDPHLQWTQSSLSLLEDWPVWPVEEIRELAESQRCSWAVITRHHEPEQDCQSHIDELLCIFPEVAVDLDFARVGRMWSGVLEFEDHRLLRLTDRLLLPESQFVKRLIDLAIVVPLLVVVAPFLGLMALLIKLTSRGPAFYSQKRVGRGGVTFSVWKLRTMVDNANEMLAIYLERHPEMRAEWDKFQKLKKDPRVTWIGHILRKTSLDELPQIWNVFVGEMSLVGPRPCMTSQVGLYQSVFPLYARVRPGITGLWQVNGRNKTTFETRVSYDAQYVRNWSPWLDLYILGRTVTVVLTAHGAS